MKNREARGRFVDRKDLEIRFFSIKWGHIKKYMSDFGYIFFDMSKNRHIKKYIIFLAKPQNSRKKSTATPEKRVLRCSARYFQVILTNDRRIMESDGDLQWRSALSTEINILRYSAVAAMRVRLGKTSRLSMQAPRAESLPIRSS